MITELYLNTTRLDTNCRHCVALKNISFPEMSMATTKRGGFLGQVVSPPTFLSYRIMMEWVIVGSSFSNLVTERDTFIKLIGSIIKSGGAVLKVSRANSTNLQIEVKSGKVTGELKAGDGTASKLLVELEAEYPFFQSQTQKSNNAYIFQGGGMAIPMSIPMSMGNGGNNELVITNDGTYEAYPIFTFSGSLNFPTLYNLTTNKIINLNVNLATASDTVVIDTYNRTVLLNPGGTNGRHLVSGDFWTVEIGSNVIHLGNGSYNPTGKCSISFRDHYLNI